MMQLQGGEPVGTEWNAIDLATNCKSVDHKLTNSQTLMDVTLNAKISNPNIAIGTTSEILRFYVKKPAPVEVP
jgi:hypothetical protein